MLVCYLDDSGTDRRNRLVTLAGYIAKEDQWSAFETEVEPIFGRYGVKVLHTVDLHNTDGRAFTLMAPNPRAREAVKPNRPTNPHSGPGQPGARQRARSAERRAPRSDRPA